MLLGISPVRISFAGGGTDMPEYYEEFGGRIITTAINHFTYVMYNSRNDNLTQIFSSDFSAHGTPSTLEKLESQKGIEIPISIMKYLDFRKGGNLMISSDVPPGSGLGSSSALAVNLVNVLTKVSNNKRTKHEIAEITHKIERNLLKWPMGKQDEYISVFGGFNMIKFEKEGIEVEKISISSSTLTELQQNLLLYFVGERTSNTILPNQLNSIKNKDPQVLESLHNVKELAITMYDRLKNSDITGFGEMLHKGWIEKKKFAEGVSNEKIDSIYENSIKKGVIGGKLTGAGGGGHLLLYCEKNKQPSIDEFMKSQGLKRIKFSFHKEGARILNLYDYAGK